MTLSVSISSLNKSQDHVHNVMSMSWPTVMVELVPVSLRTKLVFCMCVQYNTVQKSERYFIFESN